MKAASLPSFMPTKDALLLTRFLTSFGNVFCCWSNSIIKGSMTVTFKRFLNANTRLKLVASLYGNVFAWKALLQSVNAARRSIVLEENAKRHLAVCYR